MERLEVFDENGIPTGTVETRETIHKKGLLHRTVHIWLYRQNEILLQKRSKSKDSHPGLWDISAAGHIDVGETPLHAAIREIKEELGLTVKKNALRYVETKRLDLVSQGGKFIDKEITALFLCRFEGAIDDLFQNDAEVEALRFVPAETLREELDDRSLKQEYVPHSREYYDRVIALVKESFSPKDVQ
ncbi:MAG: NUDIX domain-containing protein [Spirochaetes bacterium]|nr:NUDIX domain-containing protein [Spirochaetota bacterium]